MYFSQPLTNAAPFYAPLRPLTPLNAPYPYPGAEPSGWGVPILGGGTRRSGSGTHAAPSLALAQFPPLSCSVFLAFSYGVLVLLTGSCFVLPARFVGPNAPELGETLRRGKDETCLKYAGPKSGTTARCPGAFSCVIHNGPSSQRWTHIPRRFPSTIGVLTNSPE